MFFNLLSLLLLYKDDQIGLCFFGLYLFLL